MIRVSLIVTSLTTNGYRIIQDAFHEEIEKEEREVQENRGVEFSKKIIEFKDSCEMHIEFTIPMNMNKETFKENLLNINKKMMASRGAWPSDYKQEVRTW